MLKGGSRKSTTAMMLAFALTSRRHDVLVVDADHGTQGVTDWATRVYADGGELPFHVAQWTPRLGLLVPFIQQQARETLAQRILVDVGSEAPEVLRQVVLTAHDGHHAGGSGTGRTGPAPRHGGDRAADRHPAGGLADAGVGW
jgi:CobQ/CobB/MinD/ParA nucleotide binding domain